MVLWLHEQDAPKRPEDIDRFCTAEIPPPRDDTGAVSELHKLVSSLMMHGPCGKDYTTANRAPPCMKNGKCEKDFPKDYCQHTLFGDSVTPQYRRRSPADGGHTAHHYSWYTKKNYSLDAKWVVAYNA